MPPNKDFSSEDTWKVILRLLEQHEDALRRLEETAIKSENEIAHLKETLSKIDELVRGGNYRESLSSRIELNNSKLETLGTSIEDCKGLIRELKEDQERARSGSRFVFWSAVCGLISLIGIVIDFVFKLK